MSEIWNLLRASLPDAVGGLLTAIVLALSGLVYATWKRRNRHGHRKQNNRRPKLSVGNIVVSWRTRLAQYMNTYPALAAVSAIAVFLIVGVVIYFNVRDYEPPSNKIRILIADFTGSDEREQDITNYLITDLTAALRPFEDVEVKTLGRAISGPNGASIAREVGMKRNATIVIWGWYDTKDQEVSLSVNFEVLNKPSDELKFKPEAYGKIQVFGLSGFSLQTRLSNQMVYLSLVTIGMTRYAANDWAGAIERFSAALEQTKEPVPALERAKVYRLRANSYIWSHSYELAIVDYSEAIMLEPNDATMYANRGMANALLDRYEQAVNDCDKAIRLSSGVTTAYETCGSVYLFARKLDKALPTLNKAVEFQPNDEGNYINRGAVHIFMKHYGMALSDYNKAIEINPQSFSAYYGRGLVYLNRNEFNNAFRDFDVSIKLNPQDYRAYRKRGLAQSVLGNYEEALADYNKSIELQPENDEAISNRASAYQELGDYTSAISDMSKLIELRPSDPEPYYLRGCMYFQIGEINKAIQDLNKAIELDPEYIKAYFYKGKVYMEQSLYEDAINEYTKIISLDPNNPEAYLYRGIVYKLTKDITRAIEDLQKVIQMGGNSSLIEKAKTELEGLNVTEQALSMIIYTQ